MKIREKEGCLGFEPVRRIDEEVAVSVILLHLFMPAMDRLQRLHGGRTHDP